MKRTLLTLLILLPMTTIAQQNLFNIASGDITGKKRVFYQHQLNFYNLYSLESKQHLVYGLGKNWEVGANLINMKFNLNGTTNQNQWIDLIDTLNSSPVSPLMLFTAQKGFPILPDNLLRFNVGTQMGTNIITENGRSYFAHKSYALLASELPNHIKLTGGAYLTNKAFVGSGNTLGWMIGYEVPLSKRWFLMGDILSGSNSNSVAVIGGMVNVSKYFQLCFGGIIPTPQNKTTPYGVVLEVNLLSWALWD